MKACRVVRETAVQTETKESSHQTSGQSAGAIGRKRLGKEQVCKWGLGSSRASKVEGEREREADVWLSRLLYLPE